MDDEGRIAVAGAGIAGLTCARQFASRGYDIDVYERAAALSEVGAGIQLSPNVGRVLSLLGLDAALDARAVRPVAVQMRSRRDGRPIARAPPGAAGSGPAERRDSAAAAARPRRCPALDAGSDRPRRTGRRA